MTYKMKVADYILIDKVYSNFISFQEMIKSIILESEINNQISILEIGSGTGITTKIILNSTDNIKLTSIDIDKEMIVSVSQSLSSFSNVNFVESDALKFVEMVKNNYYDYVISGFTIHNFANDYRQKLFEEIYRVLKPKGFLINADKFVSDNKEKQIEGLKYRLGSYVDTLIPLGKFELLKEWVTHYIDDQQPNKLLKFDEILEILQNMGFTNLEYRFKSEIEMLGVLIAQK